MTEIPMEKDSFVFNIALLQKQCVFDVPDWCFKISVVSHKSKLQVD